MLKIGYHAINTLCTAISHSNESKSAIPQEIHLHPSKFSISFHNLQLNIKFQIKMTHDLLTGALRSPLTLLRPSSCHSAHLSHLSVYTCTRLISIYSRLLLTSQVFFLLVYVGVTMLGTTLWIVHSHLPSFSVSLSVGLWMWLVDLSTFVCHACNDWN